MDREIWIEQQKEKYKLTKDLQAVIVFYGFKDREFVQKLSDSLNSQISKTGPFSSKQIEIANKFINKKV